MNFYSNYNVFYAFNRFFYESFSKLKVEIFNPICAFYTEKWVPKLTSDNFFDYWLFSGYKNIDSFDDNDYMSIIK